MAVDHRVVQDRGEIRLHPGSAAGHRDRVLIRRETERDADVIRAITTAAFASRRPPAQVPPKGGLNDELRTGPAWLPALSLLAVIPAGEVIGHLLCTRGASARTPSSYYRRFGFELSTVYQITPPRLEWQPHYQIRVLTNYQPRLRGMFT
jgi:putative acetyltransferase